MEKQHGLVMAVNSKLNYTHINPTTTNSTIINSTDIAHNSNITNSTIPNSTDITHNSNITNSTRLNSTVTATTTTSTTSKHYTDTAPNINIISRINSKDTAPTTIIKIATWNMRTSGPRGENLEKLVLEVGRQGIDFCSLQEVRKKQQGTQTIKMDDINNNLTYNYKLYFSGSDEGGNHGVGILVKDTNAKFYEDWNHSELFPERIMWVVMDGMTIISFYGFTEKLSNYKTTSKEEHQQRKTQLYEELDKVYNTLSHKQPVFLCGDFNARIGFYDNNPRQAGLYGDPRETQQNNNGTYISEFALKMTIRKTIK